MFTVIPQGDYYAMVQFVARIFEKSRYTNIKKFTDEEIEKLTSFIAAMTETGEAIPTNENNFIRINPPLTHFAIYYYILSGHEYADKLIEGPDEGRCILQVFIRPTEENRKDALVIQKEYFESTNEYHEINYESIESTKKMQKIKSHLHFPIKSAEGKILELKIQTMLKKTYDKLLLSYVESY